MNVITYVTFTVHLSTIRRNKSFIIGGVLFQTYTSHICVKTKTYKNEEPANLSTCILGGVRPRL